jgi:hypothetical protein
MKFFINISAFYWVLFFYILDNQVFILKYFYLDRLLSYIFYLLIGILLGWFSLKVAIKNTKNHTEDNLTIKKIYPIYTELMPVYLSIIIIAFSLNSIEISNAIATVILLIGIFIFFQMSNIGYINPIWYLKGYRIYKIDNEESIYILIIHKNDFYKSIKRIDGLIRIDEYIFIKKR